MSFTKVKSQKEIDDIVNRNKQLRDEARARVTEFTLGQRAVSEGYEKALAPILAAIKPPAESEYELIPGMIGRDFERDPLTREVVATKPTPQTLGSFLVTLRDELKKQSVTDENIETILNDIKSNSDNVPTALAEMQRVFDSLGATQEEILNFQILMASFDPSLVGKIPKVNEIIRQRKLDEMTNLVDMITQVEEENEGINAIFNNETISQERSDELSERKAENESFIGRHMARYEDLRKEVDELRESERMFFHYENPNEPIEESVETPPPQIEGIEVPKEEIDIPRFEPDPNEPEVVIGTVTRPSTPPPKKKTDYPPWSPFNRQIYEGRYNTPKPVESSGVNYTITVEPDFLDKNKVDITKTSAADGSRSTITISRTAQEVLSGSSKKVKDNIEKLTPDDVDVFDEVKRYMRFLYGDQEKKPYGALTSLINKRDKILGFGLEITSVRTGEAIKPAALNKYAPYSIVNNLLGHLGIDKDKLLNYRLLDAWQTVGGGINDQMGPRVGYIYKDHPAPDDLVRLLTRRFNANIPYDDESIKVFGDLVKASGLPIKRSNKKIQLVYGPVKTAKSVKASAKASKAPRKKSTKVGAAIGPFMNPQELLDRLALIGGSIQAGNSSLELRNEGAAILDKLLELKMIKAADHKKATKGLGIYQL